MRAKQQQEETKGFEVISVRMQCSAKMTGMCQNCQNVISNFDYSHCYAQKDHLQSADPFHCGLSLKYKTKQKTLKTRMTAILSH